MLKPVLALFFAIVLIFSCSSEQRATNAKEAPRKCELVRYARHLKICSRGDSYFVEILDPDKKDVRFKAVFGPNEPATLPEGYMFIKTPVRNMAVLSATQIGMLSKVGKTDAVCAVSSGNYVYEPRLITALQNKRVLDLGSESEYAPEKIIAAGASYVLYSDFGKSFPNEKKLEKMGVTCIPIPDWRELKPLGKAEWILFMGIMTGSFEKADQSFRRTENRYHELKGMMKNLRERPLILSGNMIGDSWAAPNGNSYHATLIEDAGGDYLYAQEKGTGSTLRTIEQVMKESAKAQYWINPGYTDCSGILMNSPKLRNLKLMHTENIWCYSGNMNKYWERSASEPDRVLEDLIRIFHPGKLPHGAMHFYGKVTK
ncbi:MAG: ABC transporter substrate-binding protein [Bacteroidota bacterium]|jgi:iron complex transport system substrate-binding protein